MLNYIWAGVVVLSIVYAAVTGNLDNCITGGMNGAKNAVTFIISIVGMISLWSGIMKIAEKSGLINALSRKFTPIFKLLFPQIDDSSPAKNYITSNIIANIFGLGNAATPLGLKAMTELDKINKGAKDASYAMCMFVVLNTASLQLIPTTIIAMRSSLGSEDPFIVIPAIWIASLIGVVAAIMSVVFMHKFSKR